MKVKELLADQHVVTAGTEEPLARVAALMRQHGISGVPLTDQWGALAGLVTATDLLRLSTPTHDTEEELPVDPGWSPAQRTVTHHPDWQEMPAREAMVTDLCTVGEDDDVREAARRMINHEVHRAVVLGADRNVVGVLSALDLTLLVAEARTLDVPELPGRG